MLLDYHEIDPSAMASQQLEFFQHQKEIELYGMTRKEFDEMDPDIYARYLAGYLQYDL